MTTSLRQTDQLLTVRLKAITELLAHHKDSLQKSELLLTQEHDLEGLKTLNRPIEILQEHHHLYRCTTCGELKLVPDFLEGDSLLHVCDRATLRFHGKLSRLLDSSENCLTLPLGTLALKASGPLDELILWAHSIQLGLDNPLKGI